MKPSKITILTGDSNNAGDFLIVEKTKQLFKYFLPDSEIVYIKRIKPITQDELQIINSSDMVVIAGGPALFDACSEAMHLSNIIQDIKTELIMFGVGQYNSSLDFSNFRFNFTEASSALLNKIESSKYFSSVRDYVTLKHLQEAGYSNFKFSGCPVLHDLNSINKQPIALNEQNVQKIVFSVGSPFVKNKDFFKQQINIIKTLAKRYKDKDFSVAFHHTSNVNEFKKVYSSKKRYFALIDKISKLGIKTIDIASSCEKMMSLYDSCDLHIGYRVHSHIYMTSKKKNSILIIEDGRGKGISDVIRGKYFNSFEQDKSKFLFIFKRKERHSRRYNLNLHNEIASYIESSNSAKVYTNALEDNYFSCMQEFFNQFN